MPTLTGVNGRLPPGRIRHDLNSHTASFLLRRIQAKSSPGPRFASNAAQVVDNSIPGPVCLISILRKSPSVRCKPSVCPLSRAAIGSPTPAIPRRFCSRTNCIGSRVICQWRLLSKRFRNPPCAAPCCVDCRIVRQRVLCLSAQLIQHGLRNLVNRLACLCCRLRNGIASAACDPGGTWIAGPSAWRCAGGGGGVLRLFHICDTFVPIAPATGASTAPARPPTAPFLQLLRPKS